MKARLVSAIVAVGLAFTAAAIYARDAKFNGGLSFSIGPWGCWISKVVQTDK